METCACLPKKANYCAYVLRRRVGLILGDVFGEVLGGEEEEEVAVVAVIVVAVVAVVVTCVGGIAFVVVVAIVAVVAGVDAAGGVAVPISCSNVLV